MNSYDISYSVYRRGREIAHSDSERIQASNPSHIIALLKFKYSGDTVVIRRQERVS